MKFDTLKLNQVLTILAPFEHNLNLSEKIFTVENIGKLISTGLSGLDDLFEACLVKNEITAERPLYWSKGEKKMVRYLAKDSFSRDKYEHMVEPKKKENKIQKVTQIYSIRIPCLFKPNGVLNFCTALAETSRIETLRITSVKMSIKMIWQIFRWRLLFIAFLPYIAFIVLYSVYLIYYFQKDREEIHTVGWISNIVNLLYGLL